MSTKMGFEGEIFYGAAGSTAATKITNSRDISYDIDPQMGETTVRGDGSGPPVESERVATLKISVEWQMLNKTGDTTLTALLTAAAAGTPVAIRTKSYSSGTGFDGDVNLKVTKGMPYKGEITFQFTGTPNNETREASLNV